MLSPRLRRACHAGTNRDWHYERADKPGSKTTDCSSARSGKPHRRTCIRPSVDHDALRVSRSVISASCTAHAVLRGRTAVYRRETTNFFTGRCVKSSETCQLPNNSLHMKWLLQGASWACSSRHLVPKLLHSVKADMPRLLTATDMGIAMPRCGCYATR